LAILRTGLKGQIDSVMGKEGIIPTLVELWGYAGPRRFDTASSNSSRSHLSTGTWNPSGSSTAW
jgi:hypothetical protein